MSLKTQEIVFRALMPKTTTPNAQKRPTDYPRGCCQRRRHKLSCFEEGHGTAPNLTYARGVPDTPGEGKTNFDKKTCTLILIKIGFSPETHVPILPRNARTTRPCALATIMRHAISSMPLSVGQLRGEGPSIAGLT